MTKHYAVTEEYKNILGESSWFVKYGHTHFHVRWFGPEYIEDIIKQNIDSNDPEWDYEKQARFEAVRINNPNLKNYDK